MKEIRVLYLEHDFVDGGLKFPSQMSEENNYSLGDLFIATNRAFLWKEYAVRFISSERTGYDKLVKIFRLSDSMYIYRLHFESSQLTVTTPILFIVERTTQKFNKYDTLWVIKEIDENIMDVLFDEYGYNLLGSTNYA